MTCKRASPREPDHLSQRGRTGLRLFMALQHCRERRGGAAAHHQAKRTSKRSHLLAALLVVAALGSTTASPTPRLGPQRGERGIWPLRNPAPHGNFTTLEPALSCPADEECRLITAEMVPWRVPEVRHGVVVPSLEQFRPMFRKLHAGQPLRVLIYGSSLTQWQAGCFHTGPASGVAAKVGAKGPPSWSNLYRDDLPLTMPFTACLHYPMHGVSWGAAFMQAINSSFPHPEHTLVNAGRAGTKLSDFADGGCLEEHLPSAVDLLVLENVAGLAGGPKVEQLIWQVLQHYAGRQAHRPAIIMLNGAYVVQDYQQPEVLCMVNKTMCDQVCGDNMRTAIDAPHFYTERDGQLMALAQYYGATLISHRAFLYHALYLAHLPRRHNLTVCRWLSSLHADSLHLNPLGKLLFSHYMLYVLEEAERHVLSHDDFLIPGDGKADQAAGPQGNSSGGGGGGGGGGAAIVPYSARDTVVPSRRLASVVISSSTSSTTTTSSSTTITSISSSAAATTATTSSSSSSSPSSSSSSAAAWAIPLPPRELFAGSWADRETRCPVLRALDASGSAAASAARDPSRSSLHQLIAQQLERARSGGGGGGGGGRPQDELERGVRNGSVAAVTSSVGWRFVQQQVNGGEGMQKYKPGWVASTVGALLRIKLSTVIGLPPQASARWPSADSGGDGGEPNPNRNPSSDSGDAADAAGASNATLSVAYLTSYQHMGVASIRCVQGCTCQPVTVDAHITSHVSVFQTANLRVTPSPACEIEVEVMRSTTSGEHKWKLISLTLSTHADVQPLEDNFGKPFKPDA